MSTTIAVTGASGFVGRAVVAEALRQGFHVRALVRSRAKAREALPLDDARLTVVEGDVLEAGVADTLLKGMKAGDVCIHLVGIIRESGRQTFPAAHVQATRYVTEACVRAGVRRYVHMSALGVGPEAKSAYGKTKWEAEILVRRSGLDWTIFRPSVIHGAHGEFVAMMKHLMTGQEAPWYFIPYFTRPVLDTSVPMGPMNFVASKVQPVSVDDVAAAFVAAVQRPGTIGEVYNLAGPEVFDWPEVLEIMRDTIPGTNHRLVPWGIPGPAAAVAAIVAGKIGLGGMLPFNADQAYMAMEDSTAELAKVKADLGLTLRPFRKTLESYAANID